MNSRERLKEANRVIDFQGQPTPLDWLIDEVYRMRRNRETSGLAVEVVDAVCNDKVAGVLSATLIKAFEKRYGPQAVEVVAGTGRVGHTKIYIPEAGASLAIIKDSDLKLYCTGSVDGHPGQFVTPDGEIWFLDWSDITLGGGIENPSRHCVAMGFTGVT